MTTKERQWRGTTAGSFGKLRTGSSTAAAPSLRMTDSRGAGLFCVEAEGGEDGGEAGADLVEFLDGDVLDAGDLAAAEVVDGEVEAVAGAAVAGGVESRRAG